MFQEVAERFTRVFGPVEVTVKVGGCGVAPPEALRIALAPAAPAARLVSGTHCDQGVKALSLVDMVEPNGPCWRVNILDFGGGVFEALAVYQSEKFENRLVNGEKKKTSREDMSEENRGRSEARARKEMRHRVMMMKADRLLTLTARADIQDREIFEKAVAKMTRSCRKQWGDKFQYVLVYERHKENREGFHCHMALNQYFNVNLLRYFWHRALGWAGKGIAKGSDSPGNVDMTSPRKGFWERHKIAKYLSKYMSKGIQGDINAKRYMSSQNIAKPRKLTFFVPVCTNPFWFIRDLVQRVTNEKICKVWESNGGIRPMFWYST